MTNTKKPLTTLLAFAGTIPFLLCAVCLLMDITTLPFLGEVSHILSTYGLAIVAFMAGCQWGIHLNTNDHWAKRLPLLSNVITLIAWFGYLLFSARVALIIMACCFLALLIIDAKLKQAKLITNDYYQLRCWVSKIVIFSLCATSIFLA